MIRGLISLQLAADFLGKRKKDMPALISEDGFPVVAVPTKHKSIPRVSLLAFHRWLTERSENTPLTLQELEKELERLLEAKKEKQPA